MKAHYSTNKIYAIHITPQGYSFHSFDSDEVIAYDDTQLFELFALLCNFLTTEVLPGIDWLVSDYDGTDRNDTGTDWSEDDVPF